MLKFLSKRSNVVNEDDEVVYKICQYVSGKHNCQLKPDVVANLISSQTYMAFDLGILNNLTVRFPRLGAFKVNNKAKKASSIFKLVLAECNGDKEIAKRVIKQLRDTNVLETIQV